MTMIASGSRVRCLNNVSGLAASSSSSYLSPRVSTAGSSRRHASSRASHLQSAAAASDVHSARASASASAGGSTSTADFEDGQGIGAENIFAKQEWYAPDPFVSSASRLQRLSPIARASLWQRGGPIPLPEGLREACNTTIRASSPSLLRKDLRQAFAGNLNFNRTASRSRTSMLHLAGKAPQRYAAIRQVLRTTADRLRQETYNESDPEDFEDEEEISEGWAPKVVREVGCGTGEGGWAAADVWPDLQRWQGSETHGGFLETAKDLFELDRSSEAPTPFARIPSVSFVKSNKANIPQKRLPGSAEQYLTDGADGAQEFADEDTLALSAFQLLELQSDHSREEHVRKLWQSGAETIVLIEEGSNRGFAAIASARALLLEFGQEDLAAEEFADEEEDEITDEDEDNGRERMTIGDLEFIEEKPEDRQHGTEPSLQSGIEPQGRGCHVVAPCPHDRPCPLLHPFLVDEEQLVTHSPEDSTRSAASFRHRAAHVGMQACTHPIRYMPPSYSREHVSEGRRRSQQSGGREHRSAKIAYVVIKRGERPTLASASETARGVDILAAVPHARLGMVETLRRGDSTPGRRLPEDIVDPTADAASRAFSAAASLNDDGEPDGSQSSQQLYDEVRAELGRILAELPQEERAQVDESALQNTLLSMTAGGSSVPGMSGNKTVEDVWQASQDVADAADLSSDANGTSAEADAAEKVRELEGDAQSANVDFLRAMLGGGAKSSDPQDSDAEPGHDEPPSEESLKSAIALMLPSLPRILTPPLKKGGHVTFDACHSNGSIQRYTIAKSSGKQAYQEVRKSQWSDLWSQDPVEQEEDLLEEDEGTGKLKWAKRRGWGQWGRVASAAPELGIVETPALIRKTLRTKASSRPSALIGADQVCPITNTSKSGAGHDTVGLSGDYSGSRRFTVIPPLPGVQRGKVMEKGWRRKDKKQKLNSKNWQRELERSFQEAIS